MALAVALLSLIAADRAQSSAPRSNSSQVQVSENQLKGLSAAQVLATAQSAMADAKSVHLELTYSEQDSSSTNLIVGSHSESATGDLGTTSGTMTMVSGGSKLVTEVFAGNFYFNGNTQGLETLAGLTASEANVYNGRWVVASASHSSLSPLAQTDLIGPLRNDLDLTAPLILIKSHVVGGKLSEGVVGKSIAGEEQKLSAAGTLYVPEAAPHLPVALIVALGGEGKVSTKAAEVVGLSRWGEKFNLPPLSKVVPFIQTK
jgi:hypothetical protein